MRQVVIENPVLNSPFAEPTRHYQFTDEGITDQVVNGRRRSQYFIPIPRAKKKGGQAPLPGDWTADRIEENELVNRIRERVAIWRQGGYVGVSKTTQRLLEYWTNPDREKKLFFCQIEALETAIYVTEVARRYNDAWIENTLREKNADANPLLYRLAFKMATGSGKTVVMAMLIAWQALNKLADPRDTRFSDAFLVVTPGITIRDRLRVLLPNDPDNYYLQRDVLPPDLLEDLQRAKIVITNYHAFLARKKGQASKLAESILGSDETGAFTETPGQVVRRVLRGLGNKKNIVVLNDEAHHCYRHRVDGTDEKLTGDERAEAENRNKAARVWISGLEAVQAKLGIRATYDLSATPFFLRGSGYSEGTLFPWVVSDFSLIDAIESGIVKVPRVPVADDAMVGELPTYRDLWLRVRDDLPKKGRAKATSVGGEPLLPAALQGALHSLYGNYAEYFARWSANAAAQANGQTPPVMIVVCNNTSVSKLVYDWVAGWDKELPDGTTVVVPGNLALFSNEDGGGRRSRPRTILVDSEQLESGEAMSDAFKQVAAAEIEQFKQEYRLRYPGADVEQLTDEDLLREVMNTVGKAGRLGEHVRCVVSVSMLTEGWDANTVTHILGVRAFGTQLLCEQVVGRALRRMSYTANESGPDAGRFPPEYAEVYGVPFSFIPCAGSADPKPGPLPTHVRALPERSACEIRFPRVVGYRYDLGTERLEASFNESSRLTLSTQDVPTITENQPIVGESSIHTLADLEARRMQEVEFLLAKLVLERYFRQDPRDTPPQPSPNSGRESALTATGAVPVPPTSGGLQGGRGEHRFLADVQAWLFPQLLRITKEWLSGGWVVCKDHTFPQLLLLIEKAHNAADRIYQGIARGAAGERRLRAILHPHNPEGSTQYVRFDTRRPVFPTREDKCHVSHVVGDTDDWEQKLAQSLEEMPEVICYVKNHGLGLEIPYTIGGRERKYLPDFIVHLDDGHGRDDPLQLILEVTGQLREDKEAKVATAATLWVPAVNHEGLFGRWAFLQDFDPWDVQSTIRTRVLRESTHA